MIAPSIQKDIVHVIAAETRKAIIKDIGDDLFEILVDESRDVSCNEQMALVLRFVNNEGCVRERFIGIKHISDTSAASLKDAIVSMLSEYRLSPSRIRGQGHDGASNMRGEFNGLKTLIMRDTPSAYYIHCFPHQLQLTLVFVAKNHFTIDDFFDWISLLLNMIGASCKRQDNLREKQTQKVAESLANHDIGNGRGLNQERGIKRAGDTRWGSHYGSLLNVISIYSSIIEVLEDIVEGGTIQDQRAEANHILEMMETFDFAFCVHLMVKLLGITNDFNFALQKKDQEIVNAMSLVRVAKDKLHHMRENEWEILMENVSSFCNAHDIVVPSMDDSYVPRRSRRSSQLQELRTRFNEVNTKLLLSVACLAPSNNCHAFDEKKLVTMAGYYPKELYRVEVAALRHQLMNYIVDVRQEERFVGLKGIGDLAKKMVETRKYIIYQFVYLLLKLALILLVATSTVERAFSAIKLIKSDLRNKIGDEFFEDCLIAYIEKGVFNSISNDEIIDFFQGMKTRREQL